MMPGAVQTCGIASSRRDLSAYPIFIAPGFIFLSESGWERSAGFSWINLISIISKLRGLVPSSQNALRDGLLTPSASERVPTDLRILHDMIALLQENKIR